MPDRVEGDPPKRSYLQRIEAEGQAAARAAAEELIRGTIANGGKVDVERLQMLGPDVAREYDDMLGARAAAADNATPMSTPAKKAPLGKWPSPGASKTAPKARSPATQPAKSARARLLRIETGWKNLARERADFTDIAVRHGLIVALCVGVLALVIVIHFDL